VNATTNVELAGRCIGEVRGARRQVLKASSGPDVCIAELERCRAALYRRTRALKAPTDPADEPAFLAELEAIEHEAAELAAAKVALDKA
jgi:hypothetical protein